MRTLLIKTAVIFLALLGFATVQMRAEIPIIQADTVFLGFPGGGSVSGIVFGPTGETVIVMHDAQPVEIDIKTKQILREFEKVPNLIDGGSWFFIDYIKNIVGARFTSSELLGIKDFSGMAIWDLISGKIIKAIPGVILQKNNQYYCTYFYNSNNSQKYLGKFDINTFKMVDSVYLPKDQTGDGYAEWGAIGIIPNSNKVLIGANRYNEYTQGEKEYILAELYLLDFDTKKLTKIPIPYETGQKTSFLKQIEVSDKYNIATINIWGTGNTYFVYDQNFTFLYKLTNQDFVNMTDIGQVQGSKIVTTIMNDNLLFYLYNTNYTTERMAFYNIQDKQVTKYLGFIGNGTGEYDPDFNKIATYKIIGGLTGIYDVYSLPVSDLPKELTSNINYSNNQLEFNSTKAFIGETDIYDTTGKLIINIGTQPYVIGKNIIRINQPLALGVYILTIKDNTSQSSYKFVVE